LLVLNLQQQLQKIQKKANGMGREPQKKANGMGRETRIEATYTPMAKSTNTTQKAFCSLMLIPPGFAPRIPGHS